MPQDVDSKDRMIAQKKTPEVEVELKIKLSSADLEKVFQTLSKKGALPEIKNKFLSRAYYDTPDLDLYSQGLSLRVQHKPGKSGGAGHYEQTLKVEMSPEKGAVLVRKECVDNIDAQKPSLEAVSDPQACELIKPFKGKSLVPIFTSAIERRYFEMELQSGAVEVAFDVGKLILADGGVHQDFSEIEVEVKRGGADIIEAIKKEILSLAPSAKVQPLSKSVQGSRLYLQHKR